MNATVLPSSEIAGPCITLKLLMLTWQSEVTQSFWAIAVEGRDVGGFCAAKIGLAGFTFDQFIQWAVGTGNLEDATKYPDFDSLPAKKCLHWITNLSAVLKAMTAAYGHEQEPVEGPTDEMLI